MYGDWAESVGVAVRFDPRAGKGSHGRLYYGGRFTTIKNRRKEIGAGALGGDAPAARAEPRRSLSAVGGRMTQRLVWPVDLQRQEGGSILVSFPDIPEAAP